MNYLSVCSGIEAATVAWHPLGWEPVAFADIEKFPSAVLAHHYPQVPNHGDLTKFNEWPDYADRPIDLLVGGTPCQSFSVAGLRKGLDDPRGNLALTFLALARRYRPRWVVWENVPGVLSDQTNAFGAFLVGLGQLGYGWAYRVLDAQYFGVAQRRRRVFVVAYLGAWQPAATVLLEPESLRGDSPPRRQPRQDTAPTISARTKGGGGLGTDAELDGALIAGTVSSKWSKGTGGPAGDECQNLVTHSLRAEGHDASEDGTGRGTPIVPVGIDGGEIGYALRANASHSGDKGDGGVNTTFAIQERAVSENPNAGPQGKGYQEDHAYTLEARHHVQAIAFDCKASGQNGFGVGEIASTLRAMPHNGSHQNGGGHQAVATFQQSSQAGKGTIGYDDSGITKPVKTQPDGQMIHAGMAVRRLTPRECERLQGFPDDYTLIPWRGKPAADCPDGPRYKALGNSMAVPVMHWIGQRIAQVDAILTQAKENAA
jgi:DNA (cytosine-5)-methyltransferase 1